MAHGQIQTMVFLGSTPYRNIDVDEIADQVKATEGTVFFCQAINLSSAVLYLKFYNAAAADVVVGTTVPTFTFPVPTQGDTNGAGWNVPLGSNGVKFDTGITIAATTGIGDADTGAPGANELVVNMGYL